MDGLDFRLAFAFEKAGKIRDLMESNGQTLEEIIHTHTIGHNLQWHMIEYQKVVKLRKMKSFHN